MVLKRHLELGFAEALQNYSKVRVRERKVIRNNIKMFIRFSRPAFQTFMFVKVHNGDESKFRITRNVKVRRRGGDVR